MEPATVHADTATPDRGLLDAGDGAALAASDASASGSFVGHPSVLDRLRARLAAVRAFAEEPSLIAAGARALAAICESEDYQLGALWIVDDARDVLRCVAVHQCPAQAADTQRLVPYAGCLLQMVALRRNDGLPGLAWARGAAVWRDGLAQEAHESLFPKAFRGEVTSRCCFPLRAGTTLAGVIELHGLGTRHADSRAASAMEDLGADLGPLVVARRRESLRTRDAAPTTLDAHPDAASLREVSAGAARELDEAATALRVSCGIDGHTDRSGLLPVPPGLEVAVERIERVASVLGAIARGLPADASGTTIAPGPAEKVGRGRPRVLVIDDDVAVAAAIAHELAAYDVTIANGGRRALQILFRPHEFDVVLCDLMMPEVTGMDVFELVRVHDPACTKRFVFMTGAAFTNRASSFLDEVRNPRLLKPFSGGALRDIVDRHHRRALGLGRPTWDDVAAPLGPMPP